MPVKIKSESLQKSTCVFTTNKANNIKGFIHIPIVSFGCIKLLHTSLYSYSKKVMVNEICTFLITSESPHNALKQCIRI